MKLIVLLLWCLLSIAAQADRTIVWDNHVVTIILPVGEDVRITFPTDVTLQIPTTLTSVLESLAPNQQMVYWRAKDIFDKTRVIATSLDNQSVYLFDLAAQKDAIKESIVIEDPDRVIAQQTEENISNISSELSDPAEIVLTRFAAQSLYAPRRLIPTNPNINSLATTGIAADFPLLRSQFGEQYHVDVVGAWSGYGLYITAVQVINQSDIQVSVNPGLIQGNFTHVTAQHLHLGPMGSLEDRTSLYLISSVPFASAILEDGYGY